MLAYPALLDVPRELVVYVSTPLATNRRALGTRRGTRALRCWSRHCSCWSGSERAETWRWPAAGFGISQADGVPVPGRGDRGSGRPRAGSDCGAGAGRRRRLVACHPGRQGRGHRPAGQQEGKAHRRLVLRQDPWLRRQHLSDDVPGRAARLGLAMSNPAPNMTSPAPAETPCPPSMPQPPNSTCPPWPTTDTTAPASACSPRSSNPPTAPNSTSTPAPTCCCARCAVSANAGSPCSPAAGEHSNMSPSAPARSAK